MSPTLIGLIMKIKIYIENLIKINFPYGKNVSRVENPYNYFEVKYIKFWHVENWNSQVTSKLLRQTTVLPPTDRHNIHSYSRTVHRVAAKFTCNGLATAVAVG